MLSAAGNRSQEMFALDMLLTDLRTVQCNLTPAVNMGCSVWANLEHITFNKHKNGQHVLSDMIQ